MCEYLQTPKHYFLERFPTRCSPKATWWVWLNQPCGYSEIVKRKWAWSWKTWVWGLVLSGASQVGFWTSRLSCMFIFSSKMGLKLFISQSEGLSFKAPRDIMTISFIAECLGLTAEGSFKIVLCPQSPMRCQGFPLGSQDGKCVYISMPFERLLGLLAYG